MSGLPDEALLETYCPNGQAFDAMTGTCGPAPTGPSPFTEKLLAAAKAKCAVQGGTWNDMDSVCDGLEGSSSTALFVAAGLGVGLFAAYKLLFAR